MYQFDFRVIWDYNDGDYARLMANAIIWASQAEIQTLPMPLSTPPVQHEYKDDHPMHGTTADTIMATVYIRDDDHGRIIPLGSTTPVSENFNSYWGTYGNNPPTGWTIEDYGSGSGWDRNDWHRYYWYSWYPSGTSSYAARVYFSPTEWQDERLITPSFSVVGANLVEMEWDQFINDDSFSTYEPNAQDIDISFDGGPWITLASWTQEDTDGHESVSTSIPSGALSAQFRFRYRARYEWYWYVDNVEITVTNAFVVSGICEGYVSVEIANVEPTIVGPSNPDTLAIEGDPIIVEPGSISDPGMGAGTEEFMYRLDFDDGNGYGDWMYHGAVSPGDLDVLLVHWIDMVDTSPWMTNVLAAFNDNDNIANFDIWNFWTYGRMPVLSELLAYDVVAWGNNYAYLGANPQFIELGDTLADYMDTGGHVITMMTTYGQSAWALGGRFITEDYGPFEQLMYAFGSPSLGTIYDPTHPIMQGVVDVRSDGVYSGDYPTTDGGVLLADWVGDNSAIGYKVNDNGAKAIHIGIAFYGANNGADFPTLITNAINFAVQKATIDPVEVTYLDNGKYTPKVQIIDDDMEWYWDWGVGSEQPEYMGEGTPVIPEVELAEIEILNENPVIDPHGIRAYVEVDLSIRASGTKGATATMILWENGVNVGQTVVERDPGAPDVGVIDATIEMTPGFTYEVSVVLTDGSGGNPTWIFNTHFPSGKFKELKHTFNDEHGWTWVISNSELKGALAGCDVIFEASADDAATDDLTFLWNFGDSTPHGIHVYANEDGSHVDGTSCEAPDLFDAHPLRDPDFDRGDNDERSPLGDPMHVDDTITHAFDEDTSYYYYVSLIVFDDDTGDYPECCEGYTGNGYDMEHVEVDFS
jgi:hypothetical protein